MDSVEITEITGLSLPQLLGFFSKRPHFIWFDSSDLSRSDRNYSYLASDPIATIDSFDTTQTLPQFLDQWGPASFDSQLPLNGMIAGYLGYEAARHWGNPNIQFHKHPTCPEFWFGVYPIIVRIDHHNQRTELIINPHLTRTTTEQCLSELQSTSAYTPTEFALALLTHHPNRTQYIQAVQKVQSHIKNGDIYQLNLTRQVTAELITGSPLDVYLSMRKNNPSPYGAFFSGTSIDVMSMSPELFFKTSGACIETKPIKGTQKRSLLDDVHEIHQLYHSEKDSAELIMIVDLLRNDLNRICEPGSVTVPTIKEVETFATLHHLVSTVRGQLRPNVHAMEILSSLFPGGSITGAPKHRSMQLIGQIEAIPRSIYTGAIGYFGFNGESQFNIAIRTAIHEKGIITYHTGCGIVADSVATLEWDESVTKARSFIHLCNANNQISED